MIDPRYSNRSNRKRLEADEKELEELMKLESGEAPAEEEVTEVTTEVEEKTPEEETKLSKEESTFKKRYGDLRRHQQEQEAKYKAEIDSLKEGGPKGIAPPKSDEDIEAWASKYPDIAGIVETIAQRKAKEMFEQTDSRFKELDDLNYETKRSKAEIEIRKAHSDFDTLKEADGFHDWVDEQSDWVKNALYDNQEDAKAVISVINLYKMDNNLTPAAKKQNARDAASDVKSKGGTTKLDADGTGKQFSESQVARESDAWYAKNEEAIMASMAVGNFKYDMQK
tara:strand:- start:322 stop:1167 length:846 start_codon:yes stop_codon:yes gene_type:complete